MTKRIVLIVVFVLALLSGIFFYYRSQQRKATGAGTAPGTPNTPTPGVPTPGSPTPGAPAPTPGTPPLPQPDPIKIQAATQLPPVPCAPATIFANNFDWRAHPKIKAMWDDRKKVLQQTWYVADPSPCTDTAFLMAVATELDLMRQAGIISYANTKTGRTGADQLQIIYNHLGYSAPQPFNPGIGKQTL
jgi:hypothetical protein